MRRVSSASRRVRKTGQESNPVAKHSDLEASPPHLLPHLAPATRRDVLRSTLIPLQLAGDVDDPGEALDRCGVSGSRPAIGESGVGCGLAGSDETRVHFRAALDSWISLVRQIGNLGWELLPSSSPVRWTYRGAHECAPL